MSHWPAQDGLTYPARLRLPSVELYRDVCPCQTDGFRYGEVLCKHSVILHFSRCLDGSLKELVSHLHGMNYRNHRRITRVSHHQPEPSHHYAAEVVCTSTPSDRLAPRADTHRKQLSTQLVAERRYSCLMDVSVWQQQQLPTWASCAHQSDRLTLTISLTLVLHCHRFRSSTFQTIYIYEDGNRYTRLWVRRHSEL